jgi:IS5 family transposase
MKMRCSPSDNPRKIARSIFEEAREATRKVLKSREYEQSFKDRRKVEVLFGHLKRNMHFDRLRLRGLTGANDELALAATAQNLKKLANMRYKPPNHKKVAPVA